MSHTANEFNIFQPRCMFPLVHGARPQLQSAEMTKKQVRLWVWKRAKNWFIFLQMTKKPWQTCSTSYWLSIDLLNLLLSMWCALSISGTVFVMANFAVNIYPFILAYFEAWFQSSSKPSLCFRTNVETLVCNSLLDVWSPHLFRQSTCRCNLMPVSCRSCLYMAAAQKRQQQ